MEYVALCCVLNLDLGFRALDETFLDYNFSWQQIVILVKHSLFPFYTQYTQK